MCEMPVIESAKLLTFHLRSLQEWFPPPQSATLHSARPECSGVCKPLPQDRAKMAKSGKSRCRKINMLLTVGNRNEIADQIMSNLRRTDSFFSYSSTNFSYSSTNG